MPTGFYPQQSKYSFCIFIAYSLLFFTSCSNQNETAINNQDTTPLDIVYNTSVEHPNILLIIADDMGMDATPYVTEINSIKPTMPTLEKLANQGIRFYNAWSYPRCTPTRGTIITGKHARATGLMEPGDAISNNETILQQSINSIYATAVIGKWHLSRNSNNIESLGIDYYIGNTGGGLTDYYNWTLHEDGNTSSITNYYGTTAYTDYAIDWINQQTQPWFCWLAYNAAHSTFHTPNNSALYTHTGNSTLDMYLQMLEAMDSEMGRLLQNIPTEELANTTIIFVGDNGTPAQVVQTPFSNSKAKGSLYNGGVNVPLLVSGANVTRQNQSDDALIHTSDLFATIANLSGNNVENINESISFKHLLTEETIHNRQFLFSEGDANGQAFGGYTVRNQDYKYIYDQDSNTHHLYNMNNDYEENNNLYYGDLTPQEQNALTALTAEGYRLRN